MFYGIVGFFIVGVMSFIVFPIWQKSKQRRAIVCVAICASALVGSLYARFGHYSAWKQYAVKQKIQTDPQTRDVLIQRFNTYLKTHAQDAKAWYLLGRLLLANQENQQAKEALQTAYRLQPKNKQYALAYVETEFFTAGMRLSPKSRTVLQQIVKQDPKQVKALNMLGMDAFFRKRYKTAIKIWQRELALYPKDSAQARTLQRAITRASRMRA